MQCRELLIHYHTAPIYGHILCVDLLPEALYGAIYVVHTFFADINPVLSEIIGKKNCEALAVPLYEPPYPLCLVDVIEVWACTSLSIATGPYLPLWLSQKPAESLTAPRLLSLSCC